MTELTPLYPDLLIRRVPYRAMGLPMGRQLVVVRLPDGKLWIQSPIPWDGHLRSSLAKLGEIKHVVGPNRLHDECLSEFQGEYPNAKFHAAPGLAADRPDIRFEPHALSDQPLADWSAVMDQHLIRGMPRVNEIVFFHRPSRTLIITDLAFHFRKGSPWLLAMVMRLNGSFGRLSPSRFAKSMMKDRRTVRASIDRILSWDFDRILVGHGTNIETGGQAALREAFDFLPR
jgi:hypothetical protein